MNKRIDRLKAMQDELHDIANSFAGKKTGVVAARLHQVGAGIDECLRMLEDGVNSVDKLSLAEDWLARQHTQFMSPDELAKIL